MSGRADFTSRHTSIPLPSGRRPSSTATVAPEARMASAAPETLPASPTTVMATEASAPTPSNWPT